MENLEKSGYLRVVRENSGKIGKVREKSRKCVFACTKFGQLVIRKIIEIVATRRQILRLKCTKFDLGWHSAQTPLGELTALPQNP